MFVADAAVGDTPQLVQQTLFGTRSGHDFLHEWPNRAGLPLGHHGCGCLFKWGLVDFVDLHTLGLEFSKHLVVRLLRQLALQCSGLVGGFLHDFLVGIGQFVPRTLADQNGVISYL